MVTNVPALPPEVQELPQDTEVTPFDDGQPQNSLGAGDALILELLVAFVIAELIELLLKP